MTKIIILWVVLLLIGIVMLWRWRGNSTMIGFAWVSIGLSVVLLALWALGSLV